jgi:hypothetical protein
MNQRLYDLLPLFYREKDADRGEPLRALMAILELQYDALHNDIEGLYDDWFIETCDPRIIPYIADLLDVGGISHVYPNLPLERRRVANTIAYRRRKGTAAVLANVVADATGWPASTLEYFRVLAVTQDLAHLRPGAGGTVDLRRLDGGGGVFGPFATAAHGIDMRQGPPRVGSVRPEPLSAGGAYGIDAVGVFLWRLQSYPVEHQQLREVAPGRFTFHPLGVRTRLFNAPDPHLEVDERPRPADLPVALSRGSLAAALRGRPGKPALTVRVQWKRDDPATVALDPAQMVVGDLSAWALPGYVSADSDILAVVDPETGGMMFPGRKPAAVFADFAYAMAADVGGGPYDRIDTLPVPDGETRVFVAAGSLAGTLKPWSCPDRRFGDPFLRAGGERPYPGRSAAVSRRRQRRLPDAGRVADVYRRGAGCGGHPQRHPYRRHGDAAGAACRSLRGLHHRTAGMPWRNRRHQGRRRP